MVAAGGTQFVIKRATPGYQIAGSLAYGLQPVGALLHKAVLAGAPYLGSLAEREGDLLLRQIDEFQPAAPRSFHWIRDGVLATSQIRRKQLHARAARTASVASPVSLTVATATAYAAKKYFSVLSQDPEAAAAWLALADHQVPVLGGLGVVFGTFMAVLAAPAFVPSLVAGPMNKGAAYLTSALGLENLIERALSAGSRDETRAEQARSEEAFQALARVVIPRQQLEGLKNYVRRGKNEQRVGNALRLLVQTPDGKGLELLSELLQGHFPDDPTFWNRASSLQPVAGRRSQVAKALGEALEQRPLATWSRYLKINSSFDNPYPQVIKMYFDADQFRDFLPAGPGERERLLARLCLMKITAYATEAAAINGKTVLERFITSLIDELRVSCPGQIDFAVATLLQAAVLVRQEGFRQNELKAAWEASQTKWAGIEARLQQDFAAAIRKKPELAALTAQLQTAGKLEPEVAIQLRQALAAEIQKDPELSAMDERLKAAAAARSEFEKRNKTAGEALEHGVQEAWLLQAAAGRLMEGAVARTASPEAQVVAF